ncbi:MAG: hypothetical protein M3315_06380 [Actinomycetota bacterium]|nr:hypothetical protein [Actinomycetota bacterium]
MKDNAENAIWGEWCWNRDMDVVQIRGTDGYMVGRVATYAPDGTFKGYESRENLEPIEFTAFHGEDEQRQAAEILQGMKDLWEVA